MPHDHYHHAPASASPNASFKIAIGLNMLIVIIDPVGIETYLRSVEGVCEVHDLHIWARSTTHVVLTAHLVIPEGRVEDDLLFSISRELHDRYGVEHFKHI